MPLSNCDFYVDQGGSFIRSINYVDSSNNNAFASAVSAEGQVRKEPYSNTIIATMNCVFSTNTRSNDTLTLTLTSDQTQAFVPNLSKILFYDVKVTFEDASEVFILGGRMFVNFTVTRP